MSTRQDGNKRENKYAAILRAQGYCVFPSRGSRGIDLFCVHVSGDDYIAVEVGGPSKNLRPSFDAMKEHVLPIGTRFQVVKEKKRKNRLYLEVTELVGSEWVRTEITAERTPLKAT